MDTSLRKRIQLIMIVLSLGTHGALLIILLTLQDPERPLDLKELFEQLQKQNLPQENDSILAQSSQPEAQVLFRDPPEPPQAAAPEPMPASMPATPDKSALAENNTPEPEPAEKDQEEPSETQQTDIEPTPTDHRFLQLAEKVLEKMIEEKAAAPKKPKKIGQPRAAKGLTAQPQQSKVTLSDITKGFLQSVHNERGAIPQHELEIQDLIRKQYATKIWTILKQSFKFDNEMIRLNHAVMTETFLVIAIRPDGTLTKLALQHPQKTAELTRIEQSLQKAAYNAGLFPPPPKKLGLDGITLRFPFRIEGQQGVHSYGLTYN